MKKTHFLMVVLMLFSFVSKTTYGQVEEISIAGFTYSERTFIDADMTDLFGSFNQYGLEYTIFQDGVGASASLWAMSANEANYNLGEFSNSGFNVEFLPNVIIPFSENSALVLHAGVGFLYNTGSITVNFGDHGTVENDGYGYLYSIGTTLFLVDAVGATIQYKGIASKVGDLNVSSNGVQLKLSISTNIAN